MIKLFNVAMSKNLDIQLTEVLSSGYIAQGPKVDEFEKELKISLRQKNVCTVNSGTSALHLALETIKQEEKWGKSECDEIEVLTTPLTCFATNSAILQAGFKIKWYDIVKSTLTANTIDVVNRMTPKTRILMLVHWGGHCLDYEAIRSLKRQYKALFDKELFVIEDAAHAFGAQSRYYNKSHAYVYENHNDYVGSSNDTFCCFSFQAIKALTTGDGGCLTTPDKYIGMARRLRWFGIDRDNKQDFRHLQDIPNAGFKYQMNDIAATIGLANLKITDDLLELTRANQMRYAEEFYYLTNIFIYNINSVSVDSNWLCTLHVADRPRFMEFMKSHGIETNPVHTRNDRLTCLKQFDVNVAQDGFKLKVLDEICDGLVCIPNGWWLKKDEVDKIIKCVVEYDNMIGPK